MLNSVASNLITTYIELGLGGLKYGTREFKGYDAFEISAPAQKVVTEKTELVWPEFYTLIYLPDEYLPDESMGVTVNTINAGEPFFRELLNSIDIYKTVPSSSGPAKPFLGLTSEWAGPGKGAKPGMENSNFFTAVKN